MGMYTELIFGARLKQDTPEEVINTLKWMTGLLVDKPENCLWTENRNPLFGGSFYFAVRNPVTKMYWNDFSEDWTISSRANIKNYNDEIETFLEWVKPYIDCGSGIREMYAIVIYEEQAEPTIYYLED